MSQALSVVVKYEGSALPLRFDACRVLLGGEYAGNIELDVACDPGAAGVVIDHLRIALPSGTPSDVALGHGAYAAGVELVFWSDESNRLGALPDDITLLWDDAPIGRIAPHLKDSVPVEQKVRFTEPTEILTSLPVSTSNLVRLAANREKWWGLLAALFVIGGALVAAAVPGLELPTPTLNWAIGGATIAAGLAVGMHLAGTPYRQVWLDRDRSRVLVIEGRTRKPEARLARAPGRPLEDFDHVRVHQRWILTQGVDDHDQEVWIVTLEGPIPFASADGTVHRHEDALMIGRFASEFAARRLAAEVGVHTGLKILDPGHDQTA